MIRILIADDHAILRQGVRRILELDPELEVIAEATSGWEVIEALKTHAPDLLLMDMTMPGPNGADLIGQVRHAYPRVPVLVFSMHGESQIASRAIRAGAAGYVTKDSEPPQLLEAIRRVARGGRYIVPELAMTLVFDPPAAAQGAPHDQLSEREQQVLIEFARGQGVNAIAEALGLSAKTVSTYKFRVMEKLGLENNSDLVRYAIRHGIID